MKKLVTFGMILLLGLFFTCKVSSARIITWARLYYPSGTNFSKVKYLLPEEKGFLLVGYWGVNRSGSWFTKADVRGQEVWSSFVGAPLGTYSGYASVEGVFPSEGGYWAGGTFEVQGARSFWFIRLEEDGSLRWSKVLGGRAMDEAYAVHPTGDGGLALAGVTYSYTVWGGDIWFVKINRSGQIVFQKAITVEHHAEARDFVETPDGGFLLFGNIELVPGQSDFLLVKVDVAGHFQWARVMGSSAYETAQDIEIFGENFLLLGHENFSNGTSNLLLFEIDHQGRILWQKRFPSSAWGKSSLLVASDGDIFIASTSYDTTTEKGLLFRLDPEGNPRWQRWYFGRPDTTFTSLTFWKGSLLVGGQTGGPVPYGAFVMKVDPQDGELDSCQGFRSGGLEILPEDSSLTVQELEMVSQDTQAEPVELDTSSQGGIEVLSLCDPCALVVPEPILEVLETERTEDGVRYHLKVTNWEDFPPSLFFSAPELPPCGLNMFSSRTWVEIYDQNNQLVQGFCAFSSPANLEDFQVYDVDPPFPQELKLVLHDRFCEQRYVSEPILLEPFMTTIVKINGREEDVTISCQPVTMVPSLRITVSLDLAGQVGEGDYFLWARIPNGACYCYAYPGEWNPCACDTPLPAYQGWLLVLNDFFIPPEMGCFGLPLGEYTLWFAVDTQMNGVLDSDAARSEIRFEIR